MKTKILISNLIIALMATPSFASTAKNSSMPKVTPIRYAKGHMQAVKRTLSFDATTGKSDLKIDVVCDQQVDVPVYDFTGMTSYAWDPIRVQCKTEVDGQTVSMETSAHVAYKDMQLFKGGAIEKFKGISTDTWLTNQGNLPSLPYQDAFTRELDRKDFVAISRPMQYMLCMESKDAQEKLSTADAPKDNCKVINPVTLEVVWDVQDSE